ncbi:MAG: CARDB domain-containing protein, partial [Planctomycetia bacterium]|nr:CARDB domain-containing protein [Planctomycetia bacterium]
MKSHKTLHKFFTSFQSSDNSYPKSSSLRLECLEERRLLSVTPVADYEELRTEYAEFSLPEDSETINIIEITNENLSIESLKTAISEAQSTAEEDLIVLRTTSDKNAIEFSSSADTLSINFSSTDFGAISIIATGDAPLTIDAKNLNRILSIGNNADVKLGNLTFQNGYVDGDGGAIYQTGGSGVYSNITVSDNFATGKGGGIYSSANTEIVDSVITENSSSGDGDGIYFSPSNVAGRNLTLMNTSVTSNQGAGVYVYMGSQSIITIQNSHLDGNSGYGLYLYGCSYYSQLATITETTINDNRSGVYVQGYHSNYRLTFNVTDSEISNNRGVGLYFVNYVNSTLTNVDILNNQNRGICIDDSNNNISVIDSTISGNQATSTNTYYATLNGGGIYNKGTLNLTNTEVSNNTAKSVTTTTSNSTSYYSRSYGGGIYNTGTLNLTNVTLSGNVATAETAHANTQRASYGGGLYSLDGNVTIKNSIIVENTAINDGGGLNINTNTNANIYNTIIARNKATYGGGLCHFSNLHIYNSTIVDNEATSLGGGIRNKGQLYIYNTIVANNASPDGTDISTVSGDYRTMVANSLIGNGDYTTGKMFEIGDGCLVGTTDAPLDPGFEDPVYGNYHLLSTSIAIDAGNDLLTQSETDYDGNPRTQGTHVDMGAYEFTSLPPDGDPETASTVVTTARDIVDAWDGLISLREAVAYAEAGDTITFETAVFGGGAPVSLGGTAITIDKSLTIQGFAADNQVTIDGKGLSRLFTVSGGSSTELTLKNLNLTNGYTTGAGGAIYATSNLTLVGVTFDKNRAVGSGGAVYVSGVLQATDSTFTNNQSGSDGGALHQNGGQGIYTNITVSDNFATGKGGGIYSSANTEIVDSVITENSSSGDGDGIYFSPSNVAGRNLTLMNTSVTSNQGAGVYVYMGSQSIITIQNSHLDGNSGYGLYLYGCSYYSQLATITETTINDNRSGVYVQGYHSNYRLTFNVTDSEISNNRGVGLYFVNYVNSTLTNVDILNNQNRGICIDDSNNNISVIDSTISGNQATSTNTYYATLNGGGIYNKGTLNLTNTEVSNNTAKSVTTTTSNSTSYYSRSYGGGIYNTGTLNLTNVTLSGNVATAETASSYTQRAGYGGGIYSTGGKVTIKNSIIAENTALGAVSDISGTAIGKNSMSSYASWADGSENNLLYSAGMPLFVDATNKNYNLVAGSYAIDSGSDEMAKAAGIDDLSLDVANNLRFNRTIDMGAYEYTGDDFLRETPSTVVTTEQDVIDFTDNLISLRESIFYANMLEESIITFDSNLAGKTIALQQGELRISSRVTFDASNLYDEMADAPGLTLDAQGNGRVLNIVTGTSVAPVKLVGINLVNGQGSLSGGIVYVSGALELVKCAIFNENGQSDKNYDSLIYVNNGGSLMISDSSIVGTDNDSAVAGRLYRYNSSSTSLIITNSVLSGKLEYSSGNSSALRLLESTLVGTLTVLSGACITVGDSLDLQGTLKFASSGYLYVPNSTVINGFGSIVLTDTASTQISMGENTTLTLTPNITLTGTGKIAGVSATLRNEGIVAPTGTITITGHYVQSETGELAIRLWDNKGYDKLAVGKTLIMDGTISLLQHDYYIPTDTTISFRPITYSNKEIDINLEYDGFLFAGITEMGSEWGSSAFILTVGNQSGPRVASILPCTNASRAITKPYFDIIFNQGISANSFSTGDIRITNSKGEEIPISSLQKLSSRGDTWRVTMGINDKFNGDYHVVIGPEITNTLGLGMNQDGDSVNGEDSDFFEGDFTIALPDLKVSLSDDFPPASAYLGEAFDISWIVSNVGVADALGSWNDRIYLSKDAKYDSSDMLLTTVSCGTGASYGVALEVDGTYTKSKRVVLPMDATKWTPGTYYLIVYTDVNQSILEYTEQNNNIVSRAITLEYPELADLTVSDVHCVSTGVKPGGTADVVWTVSNIGERPTNGAWREMVYISSDGTLENATLLRTLTYRPEYPLQADRPSEVRRTTVTIPKTGFDGDVYFIVKTNTQNDIVELEKENNISISSTPISIPKTLALTFGSETAKTVVEGTTVRATVTRGGKLDEEMTVTLENRNPESFSMPESVYMPAGQASVTFNVVAKTDGVIDGTQIGTMVARAESENLSAQATLTATDLDKPTLTLSVDKTTFAEGDTATFTITRDYAVDKKLYVNLKQSSAGQFDLPGSIVFEAGETTKTITTVVRNDDTPENDETVTVSAWATGYANASVVAYVEDDDEPTLKLTFATPTVQEGSGSNAFVGTVSRAEATSENLEVKLTSNNTNKVWVPSAVIIPAGKTSVEFQGAVLDDGVVDGDTVVTVTATGIIPSCGCTMPAGSTGFVFATITVLDNDGPALTMELTKAILVEGETEASWLTVSRNTEDVSTDLVVTLTATDRGRVSVPTTVTIPAGSRTSGRVAIATPDNGQVDTDSWVTIVATAENFASTSSLMLVTNSSAADLVVNSIEIPKEAFAGRSTSVSYTVTNQGTVATTKMWKEKVWISPTASLGNNAVLIGTYQNMSDLEVTEGKNSYTREVTFELPVTLKDYYVIVTLDPENTVSETIETNNTTISKTAMKVRAPYMAIVKTDLEKAAPGTPVTFYGQAIGTDNQPVPFADVELYVQSVYGGYKKFSVQTDAEGNFNYTWTPMAEEMGTFTVGAVYPNSKSIPKQDTFSLMKMITSVSQGTFHVGEKETVTGSFTLYNIANTPMTGVKWEVLNVPDSLKVDVNTSSTIASNGESKVNFSVTALDAKISAATITLRISCDQAEALEIPIIVNVYPGQANLVANIKKIDEFMIQGEQRVIEFEIVNESNIDSGPIELLLPEVDWLSSLNGTTLDSLAPGEYGTVRLLLTPSEDMPTETSYTGRIALNYTNTGMTIPFEFHVFSKENAVGDLSIKAVDEHYYNGNDKSGLADANVKIYDAKSGKLVSHGKTDENGNYDARELAEGYYNVKVETAKHDSYTSTLQVTPGEITTETAFLPMKTVTYEWKVTPTTIEDRYEIVIETKFETNIPAPVVVMEPTSIDLSELTSVGQRMQVDVKFTNHGLIAANDVSIEFDEHPEIKFIKLVDKIDTLAAKSSATITVIVERIAPGGESNTPQPVSGSASVISPVSGSNTSTETENSTFMNTGGFYNTNTVLANTEVAEKTQESIEEMLLPLGADGDEGDGNSGSNNRNLCQIGGYTVYSYVCQGTQWVLTPVRVIPPRNYECSNNVSPWGGSGGSGGSGTWGFGGDGFGGGNGTWGPSGNRGMVTQEPTIRANTPTISQDASCTPCAKAVFDAAIGFIPLSDEASCVLGAGLFFLEGESFADWVAAVIGCTTGKLNKIYSAISNGMAIGDAIVACLGEAGLEFYIPSGTRQRILPTSGLLEPLSSESTSISDYLYPLLSNGNIDPLLKKLYNYHAQLQESMLWYEYMMGDKCWLQSVGEKYDNFMDKFVVAIEDGMISEEEEKTLLAMPTPEGVDHDDVVALIERWKNTLTLYSQGIFYNEDLPSDYNNNFIDQNEFKTRWDYAIELENTAVEDGFNGILDAFSHTQNDLVEKLESWMGEGTCASVSLELKQEVVMQRDAFDAQLVLKNHSGNELVDVGVDIFVYDENGNDVTEMFEIQQPETIGFFAAESTPEGCVGNLSIGATGQSNWIMIPSTNLVRDLDGEVFYVGGFLRYTENGEAISVEMTPAAITVYPQPELDLTYFWQRDVYADDPWTEEVEASQPFELIVMVENNGFGTAKELRIESAQPKIVENEKGLAVDFAIVSSSVNGMDAKPTLTVDFGDLEGGGIALAQWNMISTLQGQFTEYEASFRRLTGSNEERFCIIKSVDIHELIHSVEVNGDGLSDMLVNDEEDTQDIPDTLYFSDGRIESVAYVSDATILGSIPTTETSFSLEIEADMPTGWAYLRLRDTGIDMSKYRLYAVERKDGATLTALNERNFWQTDRTFLSGDQQPEAEESIHILDKDGTGTYVLHFVYTDTTPVSVRYVEQVPNQFTVSARSSMEVEFSREIDLATFTWEDITLTRGKGTNLVNNRVTIEHVEGGLYRINGLAEMTATDGEYVLSVDASGICDLEGNAGEGVAITLWTKAEKSPAIISVNVPDSVTNSTVDTLEIEFSHPINTQSFNLDSIILTRNGGANLLVTEDAALVSTAPDKWTISGLKTLTALDGTYELTIRLASVTSHEGYRGQEAKKYTWKKVTSLPQVTEITGISRDCTNYAYDTLFVRFDRDILPESLNYKQLILKRNGEAVTLDDSVVWKQENTENTSYWRVEGLAAFTEAEGEYTLEVNLNGVTDLAGNKTQEDCATEVKATWKIDTTQPILFFEEEMLQSLSKLKPLGSGTSDSSASRMSSTEFTMKNATIRERIVLREATRVTVNDMTLGTCLFSQSLEAGTHEIAFTLVGEGVHEVEFLLTDNANNSTSVERSYRLDISAPLVLDIRTDEHNFRNVLKIQFSEAVINPEENLASTFLSAISLQTKSGEKIILEKRHLMYDDTTQTLILDLQEWWATQQSDSASFILALNSSQITDSAGNALRGSDNVDVVSYAFDVSRKLLVNEQKLATSYAAPTWTDFNNDGVQDLLVGEKSEDGLGRVRVYLNTATNSEPVYENAGYVQI